MIDSLSNVLKTCSKGDLIECVSTNGDCFFQGFVHMVHENPQGELYVYDENCDKAYSSKALFSVEVSNSQVTQPGVKSGKPTQSNDEKDKPRSIVDGDYSQYCTWDIEDPETKTSEWKPDRVREDLDIMESIRHACNRI